MAATLAKVSMPSCEVFRAAWCCTSCKLQTAFLLDVEGVTVRFSCWSSGRSEFSKAQPDSYKSELLPADVPKMSVEAVQFLEETGGNWWKPLQLLKKKHIMHIWKIVDVEARVFQAACTSGWGEFVGSF